MTDTRMPLQIHSSLAEATGSCDEEKTSPG